MVLSAHFDIYKYLTIQKRKKSEVVIEIRMKGDVVIEIDGEETEIQNYPNPLLIIVIVFLVLNFAVKFASIVIWIKMLYNFFISTFFVITLIYVRYFLEE